MITIKARFDGRVFVPEEPVNLPVGHVLEIAITPPPATAGSQPPLRQLAELMENLPPNADWPEDGAAQHDHYLYGTPKAP
jgi:hypothetical protein